MMKMFSLRTPENTLREAERLSKIAKVDKSLVLREALEKGLEKIRLETAIKLFSEGKLSLTEASNTAGISAGEMMDKLREAGINSKITLEELKGTLSKAYKVLK